MIAIHNIQIILSLILFWKCLQRGRGLTVKYKGFVKS
jgi:hypothetical protein